MLRLDGLTVPGMKPVTLTLEAGQCLAIQGASGSGKSRLLRAIADLDPHAGTALLDGRNCDSMPAPEWRRQVTYLATDAGWWFDHVGDHFPDWAAIETDLMALGLGPETRGWPISRLSTGERQRLALLRALAIEPAVLLLDEPTSALDEGAAAAVETMLAARRETGLAILWVTHDGGQAARVGDARLVLADGELARP